ncbi:MAG: hypothetical protein V4692_13395 [Bdellovibrionota bacterium]
MIRSLLLCVLSVAMLAGCDNTKNKNSNLADVGPGGIVDDLSSGRQGPPARVEGTWQGQTAHYINNRLVGNGYATATVQQSQQSLSFNVVVARANQHLIRPLRADLDIDNGQLFDGRNVVGEIGSGGFQTRGLRRHVALTGMSQANGRGVRYATLTIRFVENGAVHLLIASVERTDRDNRPRPPRNR